MATELGPDPLRRGTWCCCQRGHSVHINVPLIAFTTLISVPLMPWLADFYFYFPNVDMYACAAEWYCYYRQDVPHTWCLGDWHQSVDVCISERRWSRMVQCEILPTVITVAVTRQALPSAGVWYHRTGVRHGCTIPAAVRLNATIFLRIWHNFCLLIIPYGCCLQSLVTIFLWCCGSRNCTTYILMTTLALVDQFYSRHI